MSNIIVGSERYYFNLYWNVKAFGDASEYVFCDELEEYTFYPYVNKLKNIPEYTELKPYLKPVNMFLYYEEQEKIVKVQCHLVESQKRLYITEGNFNKYWKKISEDICKGISKKTNSLKVTHCSINKRVDVSLLNTETRTAKVDNSFKIKYKGKPIDIEKQRLISKRASAMDNHKMRFVYAKSNPVIHDKNCKEVRKIQNDDFEVVEELPVEATLCKHCRRKIYIRNAIKYDTKHFDWYFHFFDKAQISNDVLERFLYKGGAKLHMDTPDVLYVEYKEDRWRLEPTDRKRKYLLYHNNYTILNDNERYIEDSFHKQSQNIDKVADWFWYIEGYDWRIHLQSNRKEKPETMESGVTVEKKISWWRKWWESVKQFLFSNTGKLDNSESALSEKSTNVLKRGDIYYADLSGIEQLVGCEQSGNRPVLIIQNDKGNKHAPTTIVAILTSKRKKKLPTHVILSDFSGLPFVSEVCLEQIKTIDKARLGNYRGNIGEEKMQEVEKAIMASVGIK